jgi:prepilin-type N-terminal cleavage/methylation domain-containing protein
MIFLTKEQRPGFTLIETLIALSLFTVVIAAIYSMSTAGKDVFEAKSYEADLRAAGRIAMDMMVKELRGATRTSGLTPSPNLAIPSTPNNRQIDFYIPVDDDGDGTLLDNATGEIEWDTSNKIQYQYVPGQNLLRRLEKGNQTVIALNVTDIRFTDQSINGSMYRDEMKIELALTRQTPRQRVMAMNFTSMVKLRN